MDPHSAASVRFCHVLITGLPGIGKTTVCKKVVSLVERHGLSCDGFFTEELRSSNNKRIGFDVVRVKSPEFRSALARATQTLIELEHKTKYRVGNYTVFVDNFEQVALPVFQTNSDVLLVDEIGKMELFSASFTKQVDGLVFGERSQERRCMLATIPAVALPNSPLLKKLRSDQRLKIFQVRYENRDHLPEEISKTILQIVKSE